MNRLLFYVVGLICLGYVPGQILAQCEEGTCQVNLSDDMMRPRPLVQPVTFRDGAKVTEAKTSVGPDRCVDGSCQPGVGKAAIQFSDNGQPPSSKVPGVLASFIDSGPPEVQVEAKVLPTKPVTLSLGDADLPTETPTILVTETPPGLNSGCLPEAEERATCLGKNWFSQGVSARVRPQDSGEVRRAGGRLRLRDVEQRFNGRSMLSIGNLINKNNGDCQVESESPIRRGGYVSFDLGIDSPTNTATHIGSSATLGGLPEHLIDDALVTKFAIGRHLQRNWRVELEGGYRSLESLSNQPGSGVAAGQRFLLNGSRESTTILLNFFRDFPVAQHFTPYLKAGVGLSMNSVGADFRNDAGPVFTGFSTIDGTFPGNSSTSFAWNAGGGVAFPVSKHLTFDVEYSFIELGLGESGLNGAGDGISFGHGFNHEVTAGFRYDF